jgi:hypothetical protein
VTKGEKLVALPRTQVVINVYPVLFATTVTTKLYSRLLPDFYFAAPCISVSVYRFSRGWDPERLHFPSDHWTMVMIEKSTIACNFALYDGMYTAKGQPYYMAEHFAGCCSFRDYDEHDDYKIEVHFSS